MNIPQEEYDTLVQEARAWRYHVRTRLREGKVEAKYEIICVSGEAVLNVPDPTIITPFGTAKIVSNEGGSRDYALKAGDSIVLTNLVQLRIN